ncbi:MAG: hypothetical protein V1732_05910 [Patescibacteria group bacterium]
MQNQICPELSRIEREIKSLKFLIVQSSHFMPKQLVSLRGMGKLLVTEKQLDEAIEEAKKSLFKRAYENFGG